jgi:Fur family transcriptional regulator, ferric uptake regulator
LPGLHRATVYRTLALLKDAGLVASFVGVRGLTEFEWLQGGDRHRLHCRRCGISLAVEVAPVEVLQAEILQVYGFLVDLKHLYVSGLCAACAAA